LFLSRKVICLYYVDDCLFFAREENDIVAMVESSRKPEPTSFDLNIEDNIAGFLGIFMNQSEDGSIALNQSGLIECILKVMGLDESHERSTPADQRGLRNHIESDPTS
jgi:hypothetical protein